MAELSMAELLVQLAAAIAARDTADAQRDEALALVVEYRWQIVQMADFQKRMAADLVKINAILGGILVKQS